MKKLIPIILIPLFFGCKTIQEVPLHDSTSTETHTQVTDVLTSAQVDSLIYSFLFECDSAYNVLLKEFEGVNSGLKEKVTVKEVPIYLEDGKVIRGLKVDLSVFGDSINHLNRIISQRKDSIVYIEKEVPVEVVKTDNSGFAKFCIRFFFVIIVAGLIFVVIKFKLYRFI